MSFCDKASRTAIDAVASAVVKTEAGWLIIFGPFNCGKTLLILTMLKEIELSSGRLYRKKNLKLSYSPQVPFIMKDTIKNNNLFGQTYNE